MMDELSFGFPPAGEPHPTGQTHQPVSGTYIGQSGSHRLELRVDLPEQNAQNPYQPLNLVSGDFFQDVGGGEWDYRYSFIVEHLYVKWGAEEVVIRGTMAYYRNMELTSPSYSSSSRKENI